MLFHALPGCVSQGSDEQEALTNIKEAIEAWLWAENQKPRPRLRMSRLGNVSGKAAVIAFQKAGWLCGANS
jgi:predicted RNase H-like HicB family nuclease